MCLPLKLCLKLSGTTSLTLRDHSAGNSQEICGGPNGLSLYLFNSTLAQASTGSGTTLSTSATPVTLSSSTTSAINASPLGDSTSQMSTSAVSISTTSAFIPAATSPTATAINSQSTLASSGMTTQTSQSSTTSKASTSPSLSSTTSNSITTSKASTTVPSATTLKTSTSSAAAPSNSAWSYLGCANDSSLTTSISHALSQANFGNTTSMTVESCQSYCHTQAYPLSGLAAGNQCYCGTGLGFNYTLGQTGCTTKCSGSKVETCGGTGRLSVYNYTSPLAPQVVQTEGSYNLTSCYSDSTTNRTLTSYQATDNTGMSIESCIAGCQTKQLHYAGVENGVDCYCGKALAKTTSILSPSQCQTSLCAGNKREYCGGTNTLLVYYRSKSF